MFDWLRRRLGGRQRGGEKADNMNPAKLADAIADARLLLHYAASRGIKLKDAVMNAVVAADHAQAAGAVSEELELKFWKSFRELAEAVSPVTVQSIRATVEEPSHAASWLDSLAVWRTMSEAHWAVFKYRWLALFFLLVLISTQMFWVVGVSLTSETVTLTQKIATLEIQRKELKADPSIDVEQRIRRDGELQADIDELRDWITGSYQSLRDWNRTWAAVANNVPFQNSPFDSDDFKKLKDTAKNRIEVTSAEFVLQALSAYILPLLYGLLGAFAYVLRAISREIREVTFSSDSTIRYGLRLSLGLLSGIAVGLLLTPSDTGNESNVPSEILNLKTLSPLGLAFVAGYAVELIFAAMDRIVAAFTGDRAIGGRGKAAKGGDGGQPA